MGESSIKSGDPSPSLGAGAALQAAEVCILFLTRHLSSCFFGDVLVLVKSAWHPFRTCIGISDLGADTNRS